MSGKLQLRSPRSEVSRALPYPPAANRTDGTQPAADGICLEDAFFERQLAKLRHAAMQGRSVDRAALMMLEPGPREDEPFGGTTEACALQDGRPDAPGDRPANLYELALTVDRAGRREAAVILAALGAMEESRVDGLLGLAVLAVRGGRIDIAYELASACLEAEPKHPRAYSIAGVCELERGNSESARAYLAAAARIARRKPEYHEELKIAQRSLLLMHLP